MQRSGFGTQTSVYNSAGRLIQLSYAGSSTTFGLDVPNRTSTTSTPREVPGVSGAPYAIAGGSFITTQVVDSLGRPSRMIGNNGQQTTVTYDTNGNVKTVMDVAGRTTTYHYDALDRPYLQVAADGANTRTDYGGFPRCGQDEEQLRHEFVR